jgi:hypothetical protein
VIWLWLGLVVLAGASVYMAWLALRYASRAGAAERELELTQRRLADERRRTADVAEAERATTDSIAAGGLLDDDGFRRD